MAIKVNDSDFMNNFLLNMLTSMSINASTLSLIEKSIEDNGTYDASDDNADGYSNVAVNVVTDYSLPSDADVCSTGVIFRNGVLETLPITTNKAGGVMFYPNINLQSGDTMELILHLILQDAGTMYTDKGIVRFGCKQGEDMSPTQTNDTFCQFDTWAGPRLVIGQTGVGEWYDNNAISQLDVGEYWFKIVHTLTNTTASVSTDGGNTYTVLRSQNTAFTNGAINYIVFGRLDDNNCPATYDHRESVFLEDCSLKVNGTSVYDFVV